MKIFVAGGTGVLGRASLPGLIAAGHYVYSSARGKEKADIVRSLGAEPLDVDIFDPSSVRQAVKGMDVILRLTTKFGPMAKLRDPRTWTETMRLRTEGARVLVDAAIAEGVPTYVHESVSFVYADGGTNWISEDAPTDDGGLPLLQATLKGEEEARRFTQRGDEELFFASADSTEQECRRRSKRPDLARRRMMPQFGPGTNYFTSIYVPDAGSAVAASVGVPDGIYNVCDDEPVTFSDYLNILTKAIGAPKPLHLPGMLGKWAFGDPWKFFARSQRVSNRHFKDISNWKPSVRSVSVGWPLISAQLTSAVVPHADTQTTQSPRAMSAGRH